MHWLAQLLMIRQPWFTKFDISSVWNGRSQSDGATLQTWILPWLLAVSRSDAITTAARCMLHGSSMWPNPDRNSRFPTCFWPTGKAARNGIIRLFDSVSPTTSLLPRRRLRPDHHGTGESIAKTYNGKKWVPSLDHITLSRLVYEL